MYIKVLLDLLQCFQYLYFLKWFWYFKDSMFIEQKQLFYVLKQA